MPLPDLRMAPAAVCGWLVAIWALTASPVASLVVAIAALLLAVCLAPRGRAGRHLAMTLVVVAVVTGTVSWRSTADRHSPVVDLAERHALVTLEASVSGDPRVVEQHGRSTSVVTLHLGRVTTRDASVEGHGTVVAFLSRVDARLQAGRRVTLAGHLAPSDDEQSLATMSVTRVVQVRPGPWWWSASARVRRSVSSAVAAPGPWIGSDARGLVPALVDGDESGISDERRTEFRRSGLTHLLAVSGSNLTIVLAVVLACGRRAGVRRRGTVVLGALSVVAFVLLARPEPSVLRAAAMGLVGLAGLGLGSRHGVRALSWSVIALVIVDPWLARSWGFALSVCATAGILLLGPAISRPLRRHVPGMVADVLAVPVAAQLACTPLIAAFSGEVSLVSVLANVLAAPAVAPTTVLGLAAGTLDLLLPRGPDALARLVGSAAAASAQWLVSVAHRTSELPGAVVVWHHPLWWLVLACVGVLLLARWLGSRPVVLVGVLASVVLMLWRPPHPGWPPPGWLMVACDVGQGDATVLRVAAHEAVVVDAGPEPVAVDQCLRRLGVQRVRLMVFTHGHADHVDGWSGVADGRAVDQELVGPTGGPGRDLPRHVATPGEQFDVGGWHFETLWPEPEAPFSAAAVDGTRANDASVVLLATHGSLRVMLAGDVEPDAQDALLARARTQGVDLHADVLKMPHHGSARQSRQFFDAVGARVATVSAGIDNDYGHPAPAALHLLRQEHVATYRTDLEGDIAVCVRDGGLVVVTRR